MGGTMRKLKRGLKRHPGYNTVEYDTEILVHGRMVYKCERCGFLSAGEVHWLSQAYTNAINASDTGIVARNLHLYKIVSVIACALFGFSKSVIGGGGEDTPRF